MTTLTHVKGRQRLLEMAADYDANKKLPSSNIWLMLALGSVVGIVLTILLMVVLHFI